MSKLLIVTTIPQTIKAFLLPYANYFRKKGWTVDAMTSDIEKLPELKHHFDILHAIPFSRNPLAINNFRNAPKKIREIIFKNNYDIIHVHTPVAAFIIRFALRNLKKKPKIIYTTHGFHFHSSGKIHTNFLFKLLEKIAGQWTDYLIVINQEDDHAAQKLRLLSSERIIQMPGIGIDLTQYQPEKVDPEKLTDLRLELNLSPKSFCFLQIAEFTPQKNHKIALRAFSKLNNPNCYLLFAGEGKEFDSVLEMAVNLNLIKQVRFLGFRNDIPELITLSNVVLLISKREGLPRSVMEAMSLERPVIGTDIRGIRDLLEDNAGLLISVNDSEDLKNAMQYLISHSKETKQMVLKAKKKVSNYDLSKIIQLHEQLYQKALHDTR